MNDTLLPSECPSCRVRLERIRFHRTGKWGAHHPGAGNCPNAGATFGYADGEHELATLIASGHGVRKASPARLAQVQQQIEATILAIRQQKKDPFGWLVTQSLPPAQRPKEKRWEPPEPRRAA